MPVGCANSSASCAVYTHVLLCSLGVQSCSPNPKHVSIGRHCSKESPRGSRSLARCDSKALPCGVRALPPEVERRSHLHVCGCSNEKRLGQACGSDLAQAASQCQETSARTERCAETLKATSRSKCHMASQTERSYSCHFIDGSLACSAGSGSGQD